MAGGSVEIHLSEIHVSDCSKMPIFGCSLYRNIHTVLFVLPLYFMHKEYINKLNNQFRNSMFFIRCFPRKHLILKTVSE